LARRNSNEPRDWLKWLDARVESLKRKKDWRRDQILWTQACPLFLLARFPDLPGPYPEEVLSRQCARVEEEIGLSPHSERILRGLNVQQVKQLAALLTDIRIAAESYACYQTSGQQIRKAASEADRRTRKLHRKVLSIRRKLEDLHKFAGPEKELSKGLHPLLGLAHAQAATKCLKVLRSLDPDPTLIEFLSLKKSEYPPVKDPRQLGIVQLYWFFRSGCQCGGAESEVRTAMVANELVANWWDACRHLTYVPAYQGDEFKGSSAVRNAVMRFQPRTTD
jgi:hypothetical protein